MTRQLFLLSSLIIAGLIFFYFQKSHGPQQQSIQVQQLESGLYFQSPASLEIPCVFETHRAQQVGLEEFDNHYSIFFFGYSTCPAICPEITQKMSDIAQALSDISPKKRPLFRFYFVSIDPENDSSEQLASFLAAYPAPMTGLRSDQETIAHLAEYFRIHVAQARGEDGHIAHSASLVVMDPARRACAFITDLSDREQVAADLLAIEKIHKRGARHPGLVSFQ